MLHVPQEGIKETCCFPDMGRTSRAAAPGVGAAVMSVTAHCHLLWTYAVLCIQEVMINSPLLYHRAQDCGKLEDREPQLVPH